MELFIIVVILLGGLCVFWHKKKAKVGFEEFKAEQRKADLRRMEGRRAASLQKKLNKGP